MVKASLDNQLMITVDNKVGTLSEIGNLVASAGINIVAVCAYTINGKGFVMFVSEDNKKALRLLKGKKYNVREEEVIVASVDNTPGALQAVTQAIADAEIDMTFLYGSADSAAGSSTIVLTCEDNEGALRLINMLP